MRPTEIKQITAYEILDSRGNPTVRTRVQLADGSVGVASVPSGASTGVHEAVELRDGHKRYGGKGVKKAVKHVNKTIAKLVVGQDATQQRKIDGLMIKADGTDNKKKLGANAILSVSLAVARAAASSKSRELYKHIRQTYHLKERGYRMPLATMNIINGGRHADNGLQIQEFMIVPRQRKMAERVRCGAEVFHALKELLNEKGLSTGVGDEGGFAPELKNNDQAVRFILKAIEKAGYTPGKEVFLAFDWAASEFYRKGAYYFSSPTSSISAKAMVTKMAAWVKKYPILSIEDPFAEDDWEAWALATKKLGKKVTIVGDDLFVTNPTRLQRGIDENVANAILIKVNQIGTLSEAIDAILLARKHGYEVSVSHRSGETADTFIADLAVAVNADYIKTGSLSRSERVEKYNRLMEIEADLL